MRRILILSIVGLFMLVPFNNCSKLTSSFPTTGSTSSSLASGNPMPSETAPGQDPVSPTAEPAPTPNPPSSSTPDPISVPMPDPAPAPMPMPDSTPTPTPAPAPNPVPAPATPSAFPTDGSYASIASNFDVTQWVTGTAGVNVPPSAAPDVVGAFRFICKPSHVLADDPIVFPKQPGASHLHTFFGNTKANADSTYESLRTTGLGTCDGGPLNRSAYWMPSMMDGTGKVVLPDYVAVYYKAIPKTRRLPRGLRMVFGYNMSAPKPWTVYSNYWWNCDGPGAVPGHYPTIAAVIAAGCPATARIGAVIHTPDCWDGINLDSTDHRSHMAERYLDNNDGQWKCPTTHPVVLPTFTLGIWFTHLGLSDLSKWYLSSDRMPGKPVLPSGTSMHSDWFGAWDDNILKEWGDNAIDKMLNCSGGQLGDGRTLVRPLPFSWYTIPRLVDPPASNMMNMPGM